MSEAERTIPAPGPMAQGESLAAIFMRLGPASILAVIALAFPPVGGILLLYYIDPIAQWLTSHDAMGWLVYSVAFALLAGLALLPTYAQAILGGWAFGFWLGFPAAMLGFLGASIIGYLVARRASGDRAVRVIEERPKWAAVRDALAPAATGNGKRGYWRTLGIVILLRLPPNSPFALTNLVLSSVRVPIGAYALGTLIGMSPRTGAAVWIASGLRTQVESVRDGLKAPTPTWIWVAGVVLVIVVLVVIGKIASEAVRRVTTDGQQPGAIEA